MFITWAAIHAHAHAHAHYFNIFYQLQLQLMILILGEGSTNEENTMLKKYPFMLFGIFLYIQVLASCSIQNNDAAVNDTQNKDAAMSNAESSELKRDQLLEKYPNLTADTDNEKVVCPFLRMLNKAGLLLDEDKPEDMPAELVSIGTITSASKEFGCSTLSCGGVATAVSAGQKIAGTTDIGYVNIEKLHTAKGIAHECGYTFALNETEVNPKVRAQTLSMLKDRAKVTGQVSLKDLKDVKKSICESQGKDVTLAGSIEAELIYTFLGGEKRGYVELNDVDSFLHAKLPKTLGKPGRHFKE